MISGNRQLIFPATPSKKADSFYSAWHLPVPVPGEIFDIGKRVIVHGERDVLFAQEPGDIFAPVEINLDIIKKPVITKGIRLGSGKGIKIPEQDIFLHEVEKEES